MNTFNSKSIYQLFDSLRFPLIVGIVCCHTYYSFGISKDVSGFENAYVFFRYLFSSLFPRISVPSFLFISGYLFYNNLRGWGDYKNKIKRRIFTLFIPYILWNTFQIGYYVILYVFKSTPFPDDISIWLSFYYSDHGIGAPINNPLWYVLDLMIFALFSPIIYRLLKWTGIYSLIFVLFIYLFTDYAKGTNFDPLYILFYLIGAYIGLNKSYLSKYLSKYLCHNSYLYILCIITALLTITCICYEDFPKSLYGVRTTLLGKLLSISYIYSVMLLFFSVVFAKLTSSFNLLMRNFACYSFFIFCFHSTFPFNLLDSAVNNYFFNFPAYICIVVHTLMILFKLFICILLYKILQITCPSVLNVLVGRRRKQ